MNYNKLSKPVINPYTTIVQSKENIFIIIRGFIRTN